MVVASDHEIVSEGAGVVVAVEEELGMVYVGGRARRDCKGGREIGEGEGMAKQVEFDELGMDLGEFVGVSAEL